MKKYTLLLIGCLLLGTATSGLCIDRDAAMIDTLGIRLGVLDGGDALDIVLHGETSLPAWSADWALLIDLGHDSFDPTLGEDTDAWHAGVGARHYLTDLLSLSVLGVYGREYNARRHDRPDVLELTLGARLRLAPADDVASPYVIGEMAWLDNDRLPDTTFGFRLGVGCDLMITADAAFQLDIRYQDADGANRDGLVAFAGMKYYWDNE